MQFEKDIQDLLKSNTPKNNILAIQLIKGQMGYTYEESLLMLFDYHWEVEIQELTLKLAEYEFKYIIEFSPDDETGGWKAELVYEYGKTSENAFEGELLESMVIGYYEQTHCYLQQFEEEDVPTHFSVQVPSIIKLLQLS
ncbi:MAG: hypothetical protein GY810_16370 [Aureispira sp.]|nr:hypothetical protein [Aureispira sp.]